MLTEIATWVEQLEQIGLTEDSINALKENAQGITDVPEATDFDPNRIFYEDARFPNESAAIATARALVLARCDMLQALIIVSPLVAGEAWRKLRMGVQDIRDYWNADE